MFGIQAVHHIGIRVRDAARSEAFYAKLGFEPVYRDAKDPVVILVNGEGVELNLIVNARPEPEPNVLMDVPEKHAGLTHVALRVASIDDAVAHLRENDIAITEGPVRLGPGTSLFFRDPDGTVLELRSDDPLTREG